MLAGCSGSSPSPQDDTLIESHAEVSYFSDPDSFADATIQVIDSESLAPVKGAVIRVLCLGGTPHFDSSATTGESGFATVTYWKGELVGIEVKRERYRPETRFVRRADPVLKLVREAEE